METKLKEMREAFDASDVNKDGRLNRSELMKFGLRMFGKKCPSDVYKGMCNYCGKKTEEGLDWEDLQKLFLESNDVSGALVRSNSQRSDLYFSKPTTSMKNTDFLQHLTSTEYTELVFQLTGLLEQHEGQITNEMLQEVQEKFDLKAFEAKKLIKEVFSKFRNTSLSSTSSTGITFGRMGQHRVSEATDSFSSLNSFMNHTSQSSYKQNSYPCPGWWNILEKHQQDHIKSIVNGKTYSEILIKKIEDEIDLEKEDAEAFCRWWFWGRKNNRGSIHSRPHSRSRHRRIHSDFSNSSALTSRSYRRGSSASQASYHIKSPYLNLNEDFREPRSSIDSSFFKGTPQHHVSKSLNNVNEIFFDESHSIQNELVKIIRTKLTKAETRLRELEKRKHEIETDFTHEQEQRLQVDQLLKKTKKEKEQKNNFLLHRLNALTATPGNERKEATKEEVSEVYKKLLDTQTSLEQNKINILNYQDEIPPLEDEIQKLEEKNRLLQQLCKSYIINKDKNNTTEEN